MLSAEEIHTYYGDSYVLQGVSIDVPDGSIISILGRNGMGKTTFVRTVIGFMYPKRGKITFRDREITRMPPDERVAMGMGLVPQGRRIFRSLTVYENLTVGVTEKGGAWSLEKIFELFPVLKARLNHMGNKLSGGEQQALAISRALMQSPQLLLMDEPTEGLAPVLVQSVSDVILRLKKEGLSILLVEQNMDFALDLADLVHVMNRGRVVYSSSPRELLENETVKKTFLGI
jgi:branched-chain amino acid transport system ATP-binding protein